MRGLHSTSLRAAQCRLSPCTRLALTAALLLLAVGSLRAAEVIPPKPVGYFNDYAGVVSKEAAARFNEQLAQFERETSNQVLVVVYRRLESDSSVDDYVRRIIGPWNVGQKEKRNGVVLAVFVDDRKMTIQTNYGLEGALPDAVSFQIINNVLRPRFRANDYEGGLSAGINAIISAIRGEYKGDGTTVSDRGAKETGGGSGLVLVIFLIILLIAMRAGKRRRGYGYSGFGGPFIGGWSGGGGGWSSGGSSGGGFSGFSGGGGGSFGGGGASGSW